MENLEFAHAHIMHKDCTLANKIRPNMLIHILKPCMKHAKMCSQNVLPEWIEVFVPRSRWLKNNPALRGVRVRVRVSYGVWTASLGLHGRSRQTYRGFGHTGVGNWGTLGSVVLRIESTVCRHVPLVPAATGGVHVLGISCCADSCQSVTTCLQRWIGF